MFLISILDGNQCDPNPCLHGGNCTDKVGGFHCSCPTPHYGPICELETAAEIKEQSKNTVNKAVYRGKKKNPKTPAVNILDHAPGGFMNMLTYRYCNLHNV